MAWWAWVIAGLMLLIAELSAINAQFYLVFIGASAALVGGIAWAVPGLAVAVQWAIFAAISLAAVTTFRRAIYRRLRGGLPHATVTDVGGTFVLPATLAPGATCQVEYRGAFWSAMNGSSETLAAGHAAEITAVRSLTLIVGPAPAQPRTH